MLFFGTVIALVSAEEEILFWFLSQLVETHDYLLRILKTFTIHSYPECSTLINKNIYHGLSLEIDVGEAFWILSSTFWTSFTLVFVTRKLFINNQNKNLSFQPRHGMVRNVNRKSQCEKFNTKKTII